LFSRTKPADAKEEDSKKVLEEVEMDQIAPRLGRGSESK
jgi:hypothetical protein